uniref:Uncharacterized protein n=1 Tax=Phenylobacterium glaciei TaxID=2803784 RepID=A0A974P5L6_9CAUL|nr:hypothetical protein JKL49_11960 [Phenylobacterium glaciei]
MDRSFTYFRDNAYEREAALQQCLAGQVKGVICQNAARAARTVASRDGLIGLYSPPPRPWPRSTKAGRAPSQ